jgi:hypothetical protein
MLCDIVPCGKKVKTKRMCDMHYQRVRKIGSPYLPKKVCSEPNCDTKHFGKGYCEKHYLRMRRRGTLELPHQPPGHDFPQYNTLHLRIYKARGAASEHPCVDCGEQAQEWAYNHSGAEEYLAWSQTDDKYYPASNDIYQYEPRCKSCHNTFDGRTNGDTEPRRYSQDRK